MGTFEKQDLSPRSIALFAVAMTASVVVVLAVVAGLLALFEAAERRPPPPLRPAAVPAPQSLEALRRQMDEELAPRLKDVDRAMDEVLERGLPVGRR